MVSVPTEGLPKVRCSICVDFNGHSLLDSSGVGANDFPKVHFAVLVKKDHVEFVLRLRIMHHLRQIVQGLLASTLVCEQGRGQMDGLGDHGLSTSNFRV